MPAILALAVAALLSNHLSVLAIAEWGAHQSAERLQQLGFPTGKAPHQSTLHRLFSKLDPVALATALGQYFARPEPATPPERGSQGIALDGKSQRGRLAFPHHGSPVHELSAVDHDRGVVLAQLPITAHADKAEAELTVAPALLARLSLPGRVVTGDALFCQREICAQILAAGGDYLFIVKENQPSLYEEIRFLFDPDPSYHPLPLTDRREAQTVDYGHRRHRDTRRLVASTDLTRYSAWPGLAQVWRWERTWQEQAAKQRELRNGITSLAPPLGPAARLLTLKRRHWEIENGLHYPKDVTLGEDRSLIHVGAGPAIMAMLRDTVISLLHQVGCRTIASRLRFFSSPQTRLSPWSGPRTHKPWADPGPAGRHFRRPRLHHQLCQGPAGRRFTGRTAHPRLRADQLHHQRHHGPGDRWAVLSGRPWHPHRAAARRAAPQLER